MTGRIRSEHLVRASASSMIRKLSVASIAGNFTKRSASHVSLATVRCPADDKDDVDSAKYTLAEGWKGIGLEKSSTEESDDTTVSRPSIIKAENLPLDEMVVIATDRIINSSPAGTLKRLATLRVKKSWQPNGSRMTTTPPLRASSANSVNQARIKSVSEASFEGEENMQQPKHSLWAKAAGMNMGIHADGIRGFFR